MWSHSLNIKKTCFKPNISFCMFETQQSVSVLLQLFALLLSISIELMKFTHVDLCKLSSLIFTDV